MQNKEQVNNTAQIYRRSHTDKCLCLNIINSRLKGIILPANVRGHGFVLDYYIVVISMKLVERKQEKIWF